MNSLKIHFSKNERANQLIDTLFANRIAAVKQLDDDKEKAEVTQLIKEDAAYVASFLTIWFSYSSSDDDSKYIQALSYLRGDRNLPVDTIPAYRRIIWDKLFDENKLKAIIGKFKLEKAIAGE